MTCPFMTEFGKCKAADKWKSELTECPHTEIRRAIQRERNNEFQEKQVKDQAAADQ